MIGGIALAKMEVYWRAIGCSATGRGAYGLPFAALRHLLWLKALAIFLAGLGVVQRERGAGLAPAVSIEQPILRLGVMATLVTLGSGVSVASVRVRPDFEGDTHSVG